MKRFLLSLMILAMLAPGLACAGFMDAHQPQAAETPCHPAPDNPPDTDIKLFKDCMKADLQQAGEPPLLKKAEIAKYAFPAPEVPPPGQQVGFVKNPLERRQGLSPPRLPVYLATQRLRI